MAVTKITWENKTGIQNDTSVARKNKVTDEDMNEIKQVVNNNGNETMQLQTFVNNMQSLMQEIASSDLTNKNNISNLQSRTTALETDNTQNKSDISTLKSDNQTNKSNISNMQSLMKEMAASDLTNKNNITNLQNKVTSLETDNTQNKTNIENNTNKNIEQDELISKLRNAALNAETVEAKSLCVTDANRFGSLEVLGNHEQKTREGYNILDYLPNIRSSINGLTVNKDEETGYITVNGTPTANYTNISQFDNAFVQKFVDSLEDGQTYTIWQQNYGSYASGVYLQIQQTDKNSGAQTNIEASNTKKTFIVNKTLYNYTVSLQTGTIAQAGTFTNYKNRYMIYKGTDSKEFELYGASPSPDHPSSVKCLEGSVKIINLNKNKFKLPESSTNNGINYTNNGDGTFNVSGTAEEQATFKIVVPLSESGFKEGKSYTISSNVSIGDIRYYVHSCTVSGAWNKTLLDFINETAKTKIMPETSTDYISLNIIIPAGVTANYKNVTVQLEEGTIATDFVEHKRTDYLLYIQQEMLKGDYFIKENDGWKEVHGWNIYETSENDNWQMNTSGLFYLYNAITSSNTNNIALSNYFKFNSRTSGMTALADGEFALQPQYENNPIYCKDNSATTLEDFKNSLATKIVKFYYKTETPTKLPCTEEQITVLEELSNLDLFEGVNNIITAEDIALLKLKYALDVKTYVNNLIASQAKTEEA